MSDQVLRVEPTAYTVSMLPEDDIDSEVWQIRVEYAGHGRRAVRAGARCFNRSGEQEPEPIPSSRTDGWIAEHRFTLDEALDLACRELPGLTFNGLSTLDLLTKRTEASQ